MVPRAYLTPSPAFDQPYWDVYLLIQERTPLWRARLRPRGVFDYLYTFYSTSDLAAWVGSWDRPYPVCLYLPQAPQLAHVAAGQLATRGIVCFSLLPASQGETI